MLNYTCIEWGKWLLTNYPTVFNTLIPLSRELWPVIDSVMPSCCLRITETELATRYTTPDTVVEIGTTNATVK